MKKINLLIKGSVTFDICFFFGNVNIFSLIQPKSQYLVDLQSIHLPDLVSRAEHHPDSRPKLAGEKPEDDGADVLSVPLRFDIDSNIFG